MSRTGDWSDEQIQYYFNGIEWSEYPQKLWNVMQLQCGDCSTMLDIGSGPGAFALIGAASGLSAWAVDTKLKSLRALEKRAYELCLEGITTVAGSWPDVDVPACDLAVCSYSFGGEIGTRRGLAKILEKTNKVAFLVCPYSRFQTDFLSETLYEEAGLEPPAFEGSYSDLLHTLAELGAHCSVQIVDYDFGFSLPEEKCLEKAAQFLADKLGLPDRQKVRAHLERIVRRKNGMLWVPNPRKSALLTWSRKHRGKIKR